jgi:hypothetical protein
MTRQISEERKAAYYIGIGLMIVGGLTFASIFLSFATHFGEHFAMDDGAAFGKSMAIRGFGGMGLMMLGAIISSIGARGLAGSGVILDPEEAREELEPYTRMVGGMAKDALDEAQIKLGGAGPEKVVMVRCQACGKLNEEDSKFCRECGKKF